MLIQDLIAKCPPYTRVTLQMSTEPLEAYVWADPGDVLQLLERVDGHPTGRSVTALVLVREISEYQQAPWLRPEPPSETPSE